MGGIWPLATTMAHTNTAIQCIQRGLRMGELENVGRVYHSAYNKVIIITIIISIIILIIVVILIIVLLLLI